MKTVDDGILVRKIGDGTVIDHIPAGKAFTVIRLLGVSLPPRGRLAIIVNTDSGKLGKKDIVKIEGQYPDEDVIKLIALVAPHATINYIEGYKVVRKFRVEPPEEVVGVVKCSNPRCITNSDREGVSPRLQLVSQNPLRLRCVYCERYTEYEDILNQFMEK